MSEEYEINQMAKEESWRMFRIIGELVEGFDSLADIVPAVTIYGSARLKPEHDLYAQTENIAYLLGQAGFNIMTGGGPGVMEAANKGANRAGVKSIGLNIQLPHEQACNEYASRSITLRRLSGVGNCSTNSLLANLSKGPCNSSIMLDTYPGAWAQMARWRKSGGPMPPFEHRW